LITEIVLLKNLDNSNVIKYYGYSIDTNNNDQFIIVTELLSRGALDKNLKILSIKQKYSIILDIAVGASYLHSREPPIIHRDLKLNNILLNDAYVAKISDFGISEIYSEFQMINGIQTNKGTPAYQSPEQFPGGNQKVGTASDVYCFGSVIYELLFNIAPWSYDKIESFDDLYKCVMTEK